VPEIPLVLENAVESIDKTKKAIATLKTLGAYADVEKSGESKKLRAGVGKMRNRRYTSRRGPLIVYNEDHGISQAFRNLPGVELVQLDRLNLLQLAPGGHLGRFVIWSQGAFQKLNDNWGNYKEGSLHKSGYKLPRAQMANSDLTRLINSDEVQSVVRPAKRNVRPFVQKRNPLKNLGAKVKLNPYALVQRRNELLNQTSRKLRRRALLSGKIKPNKADADVAKNAKTARKLWHKLHTANTKHITA